MPTIVIVRKSGVSVATNGNVAIQHIDAAALAEGSVSVDSVVELIDACSRLVVAARTGEVPAYEKKVKSATPITPASSAKPVTPIDETAGKAVDEDEDEEKDDEEEVVDTSAAADTAKATETADKKKLSILDQLNAALPQNEDKKPADTKSKDKKPAGSKPKDKSKKAETGGKHKMPGFLS